MNAVKLAICTVIGTAYLFLLDFVWYGLLVQPAGESSDEMNINFGWMILAYVILALTFSYMYAKGAERGSKATQGFRFGVIAAFFVMVSQGFSWLSMPEMLVYAPTLTDVLRDSAYHIVQFGILGIIVAYVSGIPSSSHDGMLVRGGTGGGTKGEKDQPPPPEKVVTPRVN